MGLALFHKIFPTFILNVGEYIRIFRGILLVPHNIVMDLNNVKNTHVEFVCMR